MLIVADSLSKLSFGKLMEVYTQSNLKSGQQRWPDETDSRQLALAENVFFDYLTGSFFRTSGALYLIWEEAGVYRSALRLEPYREGWLLAGLETHPAYRRKGYASALVKAALAYLDSIDAAVVYSHVGKKNTASLAVHARCGFCTIADYSRYIDGSVDRQAYTLKYDFSENRKNVLTNEK